MTRKGLTYSLPALLVLLGLSAWGWLGTPADAQIPVHFGLDGSPNRMGGRLEAFGLLPMIGVSLCLLFPILPQIDPRGQNLMRSRSALLTGWIGTLWVLVAAQAALSLTTLGYLNAGTDTARLVGAACALLLVFIGNVLGKARPNWFFGIRTPWTLSSDKAWDITHRWGGRLMMLIGLISLPLMLTLPMETAFPILTTGAIGMAVFSMGLSFWVWKNDPDRTQYSAPKD